ncbi:MAG: hypothetical protein K2G62_02380 [Oscillospiraceae bacterium]|nr:hypothetical protein [Oscillospiraceae bacterium]
MAYTNWQQRIVNLEKEVSGIVIPEVPTLLKSTKFFPGSKTDFESQDEAAIQEFLKDVDADGVVIFQENDDILPGTDIITTANGNLLYRHKDNDGSVLVCNINDKEVHLKVFDAKFRGTGKYRQTNTATGVLPLLTTADDPNTARYNTDQLMTLSDTDAAHFCRNINADLPTVNELPEIYKNRTEIDSIDISADSYPNNKLSNWGFGASYCWSSSEYGTGSAWCVNINGATYNPSIYSVNGIIPVLEIG